jgi:hypothetical protein
VPAAYPDPAPGPARSGLNRPGPGPAQPGRGLLDSLLLGNRPGPRDGCRIPVGGGGGAVSRRRRLRRRRRSRLPLVGRGRMMTFLRPPLRVSCPSEEVRRRYASDVPPPVLQRRCSGCLVVTAASSHSVVTVASSHSVVTVAGSHSVVTVASSYSVVTVASSYSVVTVAGSHSVVTVASSHSVATVARRVQVTRRADCWL